MFPREPTVKQQIVTGLRWAGLVPAVLAAGFLGYKVSISLGELMAWRLGGHDSISFAHICGLLSCVVAGSSSAFTARAVSPRAKGAATLILGAVLLIGSGILIAVAIQHREWFAIAELLVMDVAYFVTAINDLAED